MPAEGRPRAAGPAFGTPGSRRGSRVLLRGSSHASPRQEAGRDHHQNERAPLMGTHRTSAEPVVEDQGRGRARHQAREPVDGRVERGAAPLVDVQEDRREGRHPERQAPEQGLGGGMEDAVVEVRDLRELQIPHPEGHDDRDHHDGHEPERTELLDAEERPRVHLRLEPVEDVQANAVRDDVAPQRHHEGG